MQTAKTENQLAVKLPWQLEQWQRIEDQISSDRLPHALLLSGVPGIGKQRFAEAVAHYLLCESPKDSIPCGQCRQCRFIVAGMHPDLKWIEPEEKGKQIKVDQVRGLVEFLGHTSQQGGYKVAVITPAESMNINAANALLKCLEEPTPGTLILLVAHSPSSLMATIRSRCQNITFPSPPVDAGCEWLRTLVPGVEAEQLLKLASGQPFSALRLLETDSVDRYLQLNNELLSLLGGKISALTLAQKWLEHDLDELLVWLSNKLSDGIKLHFGLASDDKKWSQRILEADQQKLFQLYDRVNLLLSQVRRGANPNKQLALEDLLLATCDGFHS